MSGDTWAVVVARTGPTAKRRLGAVLGAPARAELARAMLADVVAACAAAKLAGIVAVTDTEEGGRVARAAGAQVVRDGGADMNAAVASGIGFAMGQGAAAVLVLPGDVPMVRAEDIRAVLASAAVTGSAVVVVADQRGRGTNALFVRPPGVVSPAFGPDSAARHAEVAARAGVLAVRLEVTRLADVDEPGDLEEVTSGEPGDATARALAALGLAVGEETRGRAG